MATIKFHPVKCLNGKTVLRPYRGYDCDHFEWNHTPFIYSQCNKHSSKYYSDCEHLGNPFNCADFECKDFPKNESEGEHEQRD